MLTNAKSRIVNPSPAGNIMAQKQCGIEIKTATKTFAACINRYEITFDMETCS